MKATLRTLRAIIRAQLSNATIYRASFFTGFFVDCTFFIIQLLVLRLLARNGGAGWSEDMYGVFVGSFMTLDGLYMATWFFGVISLPDQIRTGTLDLWLVRPINSLLYVTFSRVDLGSVPIVIVGAFITLSSAIQGGLATPGTVVLWVFAQLLMFILMYALSLSLRCSAFWTKSSQAANMAEDTLVSATMRLPLPAIRGIARWILLLALPYGLVANLPALALAGQLSPLQWLYAIGVTAAFLALALTIWRTGLKRYESASS